MWKLILFIVFLGGCRSLNIPPEYHYKEIKTRPFVLASWQKITNPDSVYKFYIEGDGHAFNSRGQVSKNPTPHGTIVRKLAFGDPSDNVIYLARPCQYLKNEVCSPRHWSTARFAPEIINSEYEAIHHIAGNNPIILIGFSGGAQVAGLVASAKSPLNIQKIVTLAGNLDHLAWTNEKNLPPLNESMNLESYRKQFAKFRQIHYIGLEDEVISPILVQQFVKNPQLVIELPNVSHNSGWEPYFEQIWQEK